MCRKVLFLFPFILVQSLVAGPAIASLLAFYEFDSNAIDSVGTNHGSEKGNPYYVAGVFGQAISFDGVGDYVDCGNSSAFNVTGVITVAAWIKMRAVNTDWQTIVAKGDSAWRLSTAQSTRRLHFAVTGGPTYHSVDGGIEIPTGEWHHACGTYDGANIRLYIDAVEDPASPVAYSGGITTDNYNVYIGENAERTGRYWDGLIDDVAIFDHALTINEIIQLKNLGGASFILPCGGGALEGDINVDCKVNLFDFLLLARNWLEEGTLLEGDIHKDNKVDLLDLSLLVDNWLGYINLPPEVYAGSDQKVGLPQGANEAEVKLDGTVIDDGLPQAVFIVMSS